MTLYEFLKVSKKDYDTYDNVYDAEVTVCYIADEDAEDDNEKFCIEIIKKVDVLDVNGCTITANWSNLIERNMEKFKAFAKEYWYEDCQYEDDEDEFVYQWINEIHSYIAGYADVDFYKVLLDFAKSLD